MSTTIGAIVGRITIALIAWELLINVSVSVAVIRSVSCTPLEKILRVGIVRLFPLLGSLMVGVIFQCRTCCIGVSSRPRSTAA